MVFGFTPLTDEVAQYRVTGVHQTTGKTGNRPSDIPLPTSGDAASLLNVFVVTGTIVSFAPGAMFKPFLLLFFRRPVQPGLAALFLPVGPLLGFAAISI